MDKKMTPPTRPPRRNASLGLADFDEPLWPVNLLLFVFAACVAAVVVVKSDFNAPRLIDNGWVHLGALAAIVAALAWGVLRLEGRVRHRMQVGVFFSLLVHLWLCMLSYNLYLSAIARREKDAPEAFEQPAPVTLPDYQWQDETMDDATDPTLETPVETSTPDAEQPVERAEPIVKPTERPVEQDPEVRPLQPATTSIGRAEMSAPRRADDSGQRISRQDRRMADTGEQATIPRVNEMSEQAAEAPVRVERTASAIEAERPAMEPQLAQSEPTVASVSRQPTREPTRESRSLALERQQTVAASASAIRPRVEQVTEAADPSGRLSPNTNAERAEAAVAVARRNQPRSETQPIAIDASTSRSRRQISADQPRVDSRSDRLARLTAPSNAATSAVRIPELRRMPEAAEVAEAQIDALKRTSAPLPNASTINADSPEQMTTGRTASPSPASIEAAATRPGMEPSIATARSTSAPRRTAASVTGDAVNVGQPAPSGSAVSLATDSQPASAALTRSTGGAVGLTRQQNFDAELPGARSSAISRSASRRTEITQTFDMGSAAAPSEPARIARARAGADTVSATIPADDVTVADMAGSRRPSTTEASASAAIERVAAAAPRGQVTAAAGASSIDQGAPQINSPIGEGRTSGGGQPSLSRAERMATLAKTTGAATVAGAGNPVVSDGPIAETAGQQPQGAGPNVSDVGRLSSGDRLPQRVAENAGAGESPGREALSGELIGRRGEATPDVRTQVASAAIGRQSQAGETTDGVIDAANIPQVAGASGERGDREPLSASDVDRQSPASLPAGGTVGHETGAAASSFAAASLGETATRPSDAQPAIGSEIGGAPRGRATVQAIVGEAPAVADAGIANANSSARGIDAAQTSQLRGERQAPALPVLASAVGPGGLSNESAFDAGIPNRRARPESEMAHLNSGRLILKRSGANQSADVRVQDVAVPGYRQRDRQMREELARQRGGSEGSEQAVEMGLDFLARHQNVDGSWSLQKFAQGRPGYENAGDGQMVSDTAATGLAMLAFLGAGYTHTDGKYRLVVSRGLDYLLGNQRPDGDLFLPQEAKSNLNVWLYSHGIASIALCEAYGMTRDPNLRQPAQKALDFIVASQHPTDGGWRYAPRQGSDTSVSGWQLMALKSGELSGLQVPADTYAKVRQWLDGAKAAGDRARYVYRPKSTREHQRTASRVMTAEALLMRQYLRWKRDNPLMTAGADFLMTQLPEWTTDDGWQRDSYYWYYATQVMFQMGGVHWDAWNERLRPLLVDKQMTEGPLAGSWEPMGDVPDRWGREGGRIYVTSMHLLMLEVYYRHLPLYQTLDDR